MLVRWQGRSLATATLRLTIGIDVLPVIEVGLEDRERQIFRPLPGDSLHVEGPNGSVTIGPLLICEAREKAWRCLQREVSEPSPPTTMVFQRKSGEDVPKFAARIMKEHQRRWALPAGEDGPADSLARAWPVGAVCLMSGCSSSDQTAKKLIASFRENGAAVQGFALGLQKSGGDSPVWRPRFHLPDEADSNWNIDVGRSWNFVPDRQDQRGAWITQAGAPMDDDELTALLKSLLDPGKRVISVGQMRFPRLPATIHPGNGSAASFCCVVQVSLQRQARDSEKAWGWDVSLCLREMTGVQDERRSATVLAECCAVPDQDGGKLYRIRPLATAPAEEELHSPAAWKIAPGQDSLQAVRLSPGFARDAEVAMYSKLKTFDVVWVRLTHGEIPLILGGIHTRRNIWEEGARACDVAITGSQIELGTQHGASRVRVAQNTVLVEGRELVEVKSSVAKIEQKLVVGGALEGHDTAKFSGDVTIG